VGTRISKHDGAMPVRIKAIPEGTIVPQGTVLVTVESTDPECAGLAAYIETADPRGSGSRRRSPPARCAGGG
jgi:hypothetical protein